MSWSRENERWPSLYFTEDQQPSCTCVYSYLPDIQYRRLPALSIAASCTICQFSYVTYTMHKAMAGDQ